MGFCTPEGRPSGSSSWCRASRRPWPSDGILLLKYWLEVGPDEQTRRLESRIDDPRKIWKLSDMDLKSYSRWYDYSRARDAMFAATDTAWAPWYIAHTDDKKRGRLNIIHPPAQPGPLQAARPPRHHPAQAAARPRLHGPRPALALHPHTVLGRQTRPGDVWWLPIMCSRRRPRQRCMGLADQESSPSAARVACRMSAASRADGSRRRCAFASLSAAGDRVHVYRRRVARACSAARAAATAISPSWAGAGRGAGRCRSSPRLLACATRVPM